MVWCQRFRLPNRQWMKQFWQLRLRKREFEITILKLIQKKEHLPANIVLSTAFVLKAWYNHFMIRRINNSDKKSLIKLFKEFHEFNNSNLVSDNLRPFHEYKD